MINSRGAVKIADFGIALSNQDLSKKLTSTGEFVGTPGYLSPEVCLGKPVDQRSDIFSLGIVLFEMLTGRMPFTDESPLGLMLEVVKAEIPDVCALNADVDPEIARILDKMIAKDPNERYQSCHDLVAELGAHPLVAKGGPITLQTEDVGGRRDDDRPEDAGIGADVAAGDAAHAGFGVAGRRADARHAVGYADATGAATSVRARSTDTGAATFCAAVGDRRNRAACVSPAARTRSVIAFRA